MGSNEKKGPGVTPAPAHTPASETADKDDNQDHHTTEPSDGQTIVLPRHTYDADAVIGFIEAVFHDMPENAHRLVYTARRRIGSPLKSVDALDKWMGRTTAPRALYFSVASCYRDPDDGELHHRKALFAALHVVVLDDVGTKVPLDDIPEALLDPSYIIESSPGNYQYGYILTTPITDRDLAERLLGTVAAAGLTDAGGVSATKLVRLPDGVNGKDDPDKRTFPVTMTHWSDKTFTPDELLEGIGLEDDSGKVTWTRLNSEKLDPLRKRHRTEYLPVQPIAQQANGLIDDVLEWLYQNNMVLNDSGDGWVDIICPWASSHTDDNIEAGYMPLGRGDDPHVRAFHCFHDHCKEHDTVEFLKHVIDNSEFTKLPVYLGAWVPHGDYAYDNTSDSIWQLFGDPIAYPYTAFKRSFSGKAVYAIDHRGKSVRVNPVDMWMESPYRITIQGLVSRPGNELVHEDSVGNRWLNTCRMPQWGTGPYDQRHVDVFYDYVDYLLPDPVERDYFLDWLTAKMTDPTFRGTGIVMATPTYGVGRSTLAQMISMLVGPANCANVKFEELISGRFNYWEDKLFVIIDEARESSPQAVGLHRAYESLKQRIDTTNRRVMMEVKHQNARAVLSCTSYLIITNHLNALAVPRHDRRLTVLTNPDVPESAQYFTDINKWMNNDEWCKHVFRWLCERPITSSLFQPLETDAKDDMTDLTSTVTMRAADAFQQWTRDNDVWFVSAPQLRAVLEDAALKSGDSTVYGEAYYANVMNDISRAFKRYKVRNATGNVARVRVMNWAARTPGKIPDFDDTTWKQDASGLSAALRGLIKAQIDAFDIQTAIDETAEHMK